MICIEPGIQDGCVMYGLKEIGSSGPDREHLTGGPIQLDLPVIIFKGEFHQPVIFSNIHAVQLKRCLPRKVGFNGVNSHNMKPVQRDPVLKACGGSLSGLRHDHITAVLFPAQQQRSDANYEEKYKQQEPGSPVQLSENPDELCLLFPLISLFHLGA